MEKNTYKKPEITSRDLDEEEKETHPASKEQIYNILAEIKRLATNKSPLGDFMQSTLTDQSGIKWYIKYSSSPDLDGNIGLITRNLSGALGSMKTIIRMNQYQNDQIRIERFVDSIKPMSKGMGPFFIDPDSNKLFTIDGQGDFNKSTESLLHLANEKIDDEKLQIKLGSAFCSVIDAEILIKELKALELNA